MCVLHVILYVMQQIYMYFLCNIQNKRTKTYKCCPSVTNQLFSYIANLSLKLNLY